MSLTAIFLAAVAIIAALIGGVAGKAIGRSSGRKEGAEQAKADQQVEQAKVIVEAVQERNHVEANVAATPRADLDRELREFSRPD